MRDQYLLSLLAIGDWFGTPHPSDNAMTRTLAILALTLVWATPVLAQQPAGRPEDTEVWSPVPAIVTPGATGTAPPSDAIVLFDGRNLDEWVAAADSTKRAGWIVRNGVMTVNKAAGDIRTKRKFTSYQIHLEWRIPVGITGAGQARGNSGLYLGATPDGGYELQILDSYRNTTYVNGQVGSIYKQHVPLANAMRKPGAWQAYDVIWTAPTFNGDGSLRSPAYVTAIHNGVVVQNHVQLRGDTKYIGAPEYKAHGALPIRLQSHGDPSPPISFRNIWLREM